MKRILPKMAVLILIALLSAQAVQASKLGFGLRYGLRKVTDEVIKDVYGEGYVYNPYIRWMPHHFFAFEVAYEGGYKKEAPVGIFAENSTLSVTGWEVCLVLHYRISRFDPYVRFGYANYHYKQEIESEFVQQKVDHRSATSVVAGGLHFEVIKGLNIGAEVKYAPMKVQPFEIEVDLSGARFMVSLNYEFDY
jgi:hypothetical protein